MTSSTASALEQLWGAPGAAVETMDSEMILDRAWTERPSWAILPFEALQPRWKVLAIDGQSPIRKDFDAAAYPLALPFSLTGADASRLHLDLPSTNRDPSRLTTVLMSGTSGLVRELAYQMEVKGISYPARDIGGWLREADVFHISHEASFDPTCPPPNPLKSRFSCSSPEYIGLFDEVGLDVVELTGNHIMDNGSASMLYSLDLYREHGISYYGGGANLEDARQPLRMEHNGNRFAFLGCNFAEPPQPLAGPNLPGANPCDWKDFSGQIADLRQQGFIPIITLQYKEGYSPVVMPWQSIDFRRAAEAGAAIVSGSQSHVPMQMEFYDEAFIHYGLGNLFFGQMANQPPGPGLPLQPAQRYEFLDRHVLYDGRLISTELLTAMLEDYARPRPMTADERSAILEAYFAYSGWLPLIPTPAPARTPTLYPLLKFVPLPTHTPLPRFTVTP
jgi:poly-gamma-glutamate synthesis protein (capsule biosynthesis protein)